eukprot:TRINITY_DN3155_c1_g2_i2.p1 TRINITY_DN3155_c1_g2~~TRINITY_DN3155_c1_g2_i2.p1  ORF type:complete len:469 (+),score=98.75 TRINITY_DN3155_c1_g2_i2:381-1787(+)
MASLLSDLQAGIEQPISLARGSLAKGINDQQVIATRHQLETHPLMSTLLTMEYANRQQHDKGAGASVVSKDTAADSAATELLPSNNGDSSVVNEGSKNDNSNSGSSNRPITGDDTSSANVLVSGTIEYRLDGFLRSQGIHPREVPKSEQSAEFLEKLALIRVGYEEELKNLDSVSSKFVEAVNTLLKEQSATRLVTEKEREAKIACVQKRFNYLRAQLRQNVCNVIVGLQKQYNQIRRKRRSLSRKATEVLNLWFFSHLNDPYPSDEEKMVLAAQCALTLNQVNNWFGNKRIRYKRKCLEEEKKRPNHSHAPMIPAASKSKATPAQHLQNTRKRTRALADEIGVSVGSVCGGASGGEVIDVPPPSKRARGRPVTRRQQQTRQQTRQQQQQKHNRNGGDDEPDIPGRVPTYDAFGQPYVPGRRRRVQHTQHAPLQADYDDEGAEIVRTEHQLPHHQLEDMSGDEGGFEG